MHPWMADVSLLSAPWLALAFLAGCTQREAKRAALLGIGCTFSALIGYGVMTLSPIENAHVSTVAVAGFIRSSQRVFIGALLTGPLFGWFGYRWRVQRAWLGALATAAVLCFEPLAHSLAGSPIRSSTVLMTEVAVGIAMAAYVAGSSLVSAQAGRRQA
jgi:hypothetical protein